MRILLFSFVLVLAFVQARLGLSEQGLRDVRGRHAQLADPLED